eukprot:TRINITY_DN93625_c0_g1_i1.p1 TRINITY_DN93625_c0_g1~~TRINITY_DN93625_c0_g1_i1.p1  ORF type:complete len:355 (-),score=57.50 TRINITY_DN93625_c0_g1_i1:128-1192(-)
MPPKKGKQRKGSTPSPPSTPTNDNRPPNPDMSSVPFIAHLLQLMNEDIEAVSPKIAAAMNLGDYNIDLRSSITVDFIFENLAFAAEHNFSGHKALTFLQDMETLRKLVVDEHPTSEINATFKAQLMERAKDIPPDPAVLRRQAELAAKKARQEALAEEALRDSKKDKHKKGQQPKEQPVEKKPTIEIVEPVIYTLQEVTDMVEFVSQGILQHSKLYSYCFAGPTRGIEFAGTLLVFCETCMAPISLNKARTETQYVEWLAAQRLQEQAEEEKRKEEEEARREQERKAKALKEAQLQKEKEEAAEMADHQLCISNKEAEGIIQAIGKDITSTTKKKQEDILARIMAIEDRLPKSL